MTTSRHKKNKPSERWYAAPPLVEESPTPFFKLTVVCLTLGWVMLCSFVVLHSGTVGSPDEASNKYFISLLARTHQYRLDTGLPADIVNYLHPRSMAVKGQFLAPGSFLGLVQIGALVTQLFGTGAEKLFIPLLSLGGLLAMFFIFRRFWPRWWALLGVALIALHPAFFEFSTLPFLHNGAVVAALMISAWALLRLLERPTFIVSCLCGVAHGLALFFRPIEFLWTLPAIAILLLSRKLWRELLVIFLITFALQLPWLIADRQVYGSFLASGYTPTGGLSDVASDETVASATQRLLTPPGGWSWHWLSSAWWYFVLLVPAWSAMALVAISRYFRRKYVSWSKSLKLTIISLVGIFPLVYYGTWNLYPTTPSTNIGALASYVRYWLPLYIVMAPGVVLVLRMITKKWLAASLIVLLGLSQIITIWFHPVSGLRARFTADAKNISIRQQVFNATEQNAVIIAGHDDKYFQDQRLSTFRLPKTNSEWQLLKTLLTLRPVYLYVAVGAVDTEEAQATMASYGIQMEKNLTIGRDGLWKLFLTS